MAEPFSIMVITVGLVVLPHMLLLSCEAIGAQCSQPRILITDSQGGLIEIYE
jgi:hypothetical protein